MRINPRPRPGPRSPVSYLHLQLQLLLILLALSPPSTAQVPDLVDIKAVPSYSTAPACIQSVLTSVIIAQVTAQRCSALATQVPTARCLCDNPTNIVDGGFTLQRAASANAQQTCTAVADAWYTAENVMRQYCSTNLARLQLSSINGATATLGELRISFL